MESKKVQDMSTPKFQPRLIIHGGAGNLERKNFTEGKYNEYRTALLGIVRLGLQCICSYCGVLVAWNRLEKTRWELGGTFLEDDGFICVNYPVVIITTNQRQTRTI